MVVSKVGKLTTRGRPASGGKLADVVMGHKRLRVSIGGLTHVDVVRDKLLGYSSWVDGRPAHTFSIEFVLEGGVLLAEYDDRALWTSVLQGLERELGEP